MNSSQIAKLAGVSRSTVSKVINNYPDIPEDTKKKVLAVIKKHDYKPNKFASVLKGIPQKVVALYIHATKNDMDAGNLDNLDSSYVMGIISHFIFAAKLHDHSLMVELIHENEDQTQIERQIKENFDSKAICAAVFLGLTDNSHFIDNLVNAGYNIASIDRKIATEGAGVNITTNDEESAYLATKHLISNGYTQITLIAGDPDKQSARSREHGYLRAIEEHGLSAHKLDCGYSEKLGAQAADQLLAAQKQPDAILCASDIIAYGLIGRMREKNEDYLMSLGIAGFDNIAFNSYQRPSLTSVAVDYKEMAETTIEALLRDESHSEFIISTKLFARDSSQPKPSKEV
ncbi:LacI family DNA-binding transcriptional regulator (plasmid) [Photobacterium sp. DA100]|uniref:LacI family DNA-binding transcriptional regulator n=1 Tax=Photobacterium sp. DA100 TaxID=3027472 RepID=UPI0024797FFA|nr:LacI family DNA-binding transcriptional regulator [Photobacterium sp. DA100]WEM44770.1 LacI family DNA-binding transcriptional regulator [Photobacterium sp. DA100]